MEWIINGKTFIFNNKDFVLAYENDEPFRINGKYYLYIKNIKNSKKYKHKYLNYCFDDDIFLTNEELMHLVGKSFLKLSIFDDKHHSQYYSTQLPA